MQVDLFSFDHIAKLVKLSSRNLFLFSIFRAAGMSSLYWLPIFVIVVYAFDTSVGVGECVCVCEREREGEDGIIKLVAEEINWLWNRQNVLWGLLDEKEKGKMIVLGIPKFSDFFYGRAFNIISDTKKRQKPNTNFSFFL